MQRKSSTNPLLLRANALVIPPGLSGRNMNRPWRVTMSNVPPGPVDEGMIWLFLILNEYPPNNADTETPDPGPRA